MGFDLNSLKNIFNGNKSPNTPKKKKVDDVGALSWIELESFNLTLGTKVPDSVRLILKKCDEIKSPKLSTLVKQIRELANNASGEKDRFKIQKYGETIKEATEKAIIILKENQG